jgi:hypothetical protein
MFPGLDAARDTRLRSERNIPRTDRVRDIPLQLKVINILHGQRFPINNKPTHY